MLDAQQLDMSLVTYLIRKKADIISETERTRFVKQVEFALALSQPIGVSEFEQKIGTAALARVEGTYRRGERELETRDFTLCCDEPCPLPPDKPLLLIKCADRQSAKQGDVVTFFLRVQQPRRPAVDGRGDFGQPIGAAGVRGWQRQSDRDAVFTTEAERGGIAEIALGDKRPAGGGTRRRLAISGKDSLTKQSARLQGGKSNTSR